MVQIAATYVRGNWYAKMTGMINVVVSCTERKSEPAEPFLCARELTRLDFDARIADWIERLALAREASRLPARELYQGEHWAVARELAKQENVALWVASAGHGLISVNQEVASYQATFAAGHDDSVALSRSQSECDDQRAKWWAEIQNGKQNRVTVEFLASQAPVLVAASRPYLAAMEGELLTAASARPGKVILATVGPVPPKLRQLCSQGSGRLRGVLNGSMQSVNVRLAEAIVKAADGGDITLDSAIRETKRLMKEAPPLERFSRQLLSDEQVSACIVKHLVPEVGPSCSVLHRQLRNEGMACEQSRFSRLYKSVNGAT